MQKNSHGTYCSKLLLCCATLQLHNSPAYHARELFKPLKDALSLLVYNEKIISFGFFVGDVSTVGLSLFD